MRPCSPRATGVLLVFAKAPRPGLVKTRMTPHLSPEKAAQLYACLLDDVLQVSLGAGAALGLDVVLAVSPPSACPELAERADALCDGNSSSFQVVAQQGRDLSERMASAVAEAGAAGYPRILLRGSDSPLLGEEHLREALEALERVWVAITPDQGGGYALIGLRGPVEGLFDHPMSTAEVLDQTFGYARAQGLEAHLCEPTIDLDTPSDLVALRGAGSQKIEALCPRTWAFLVTEQL
jgi:rSAM/selenodomain-associated transferase 1